jgi:DNA-binding transcriptional ArsR family regulator
MNKEEYKYMQSAFAVIAEPNRRAILGVLSASERTVGELMQQLHLPQPSVSKHLKVLREGGFVVSRVEAQRRVYRLNPGPLQEVDEWLEQFRRFWSRHVDALEVHLARMEKASMEKTAFAKGKKR